jgi:transcription initiation factor TFIIIB Brf1 subunit/transcription initiation factor TFIIB
MVPINLKTGEPIIDIEMPFRTSQVDAEYSVNIHDYLLYDLKSNFNEKKEKFINKWMNVDVRNLELSICDYGTTFHKKFAEECIEYVFNIWTNPTQRKLSSHIFYIKMLYYYDMRKVIIWAHTVSDKIFARYKQWAIPVVEHIKNEESKSPKTKLNVSVGFLNLLKTSINHDNLAWVSTGMVNDFNKKIKESLELFDGSVRKRTSKTKVDANYLPVGHFIGNMPRFYDPEKKLWIDDISYLEKTTQYKENSIIIGYDDKTKTSINVKFKMRNPIQNIKQYKDSRQIEKGSICLTKSKSYLRGIAKQLGLPESEYSRTNVNDLCMKIRTRLIYYELKARLSSSDIKYFYFLHEIKPETFLGE